MKTSAFTTVAISSLLLCSLSIVQADETLKGNKFSGNVSGYLGQKSLDDKDWSKLDQQGSLGVIFDFKKESWPVSIAVDLIISGDTEENGSLEDLGGSLETHLGVRKIFEFSDSSFKPYIGGGIAIVGATMEHLNNDITTSKSDDTDTGYWVGTGMYYAVDKSFTIGADVRYSDAEVTLFGVDRKAGGVYTGLTVGYHW